MPIRLSELNAKTRELKIPYEGEEITFSYHPSCFTPIMEARQKEAFGSGDDDHKAEVLFDIVVEISAGWDILGEDGKPLPITKELLKNIPSSISLSIWNLLTEDMRPKAPNGAGLPDTS